MNLQLDDILIEECAEVIQAVTKIKRFGFINSGHNNQKHLEEEIGQLKAIIDHLVDDWRLNHSKINKAYIAKGRAIVHYAKYNVSNQPVPKAEP